MTSWTEGVGMKGTGEMFVGLDPMVGDASQMPGFEGDCAVFPDRRHERIRGQVMVGSQGVGESG